MSKALTPEERAEAIVMTASAMNKITVNMIIPHIREAELAATEAERERFMTILWNLVGCDDFAHLDGDSVCIYCEVEKEIRGGARPRRILCQSRTP